MSCADGSRAEMLNGGAVIRRAICRSAGVEMQARVFRLLLLALVVQQPLELRQGVGEVATAVILQCTCRRGGRGHRQHSTNQETQRHQGGCDCRAFLVFLPGRARVRAVAATNSLPLALPLRHQHLDQQQHNRRRQRPVITLVKALHQFLLSL